MSIPEIARRTGLSCNTIKQYLRAGAAEPRYAKRISPSKLDPFAQKLAGGLKSEATKSRKQRRTLTQMHADLVVLGFEGYGSYSGEITAALDNLLHRDFQAAMPNEKWLTDITEVQISAGKEYLSPMIDCFDGLVISWSIGTRPEADLVNTMLDAAIEKVANSNVRPVVHSDHGAHYRWPGWLTRIRDAKLIRSMSRIGCSPDNAACKGFFGRLKKEMLYPRKWQATTMEQFIQAVDSYIRWCNEKRIKISLGSLSPLEYRESLGLTA